ncbi:Amino acid ABC transporter substrate-binding protein OS=Streptomyces glaucescens OX=1907 GN=SGLAU_08815 PE=4 SV=1 [Streptomyces glaucescens]
MATKTPGKLTIATDEPAYEPWFEDDDPATGEGFESAVAYAVAGRLGYGKNTVVWQRVPFNKAFAPGEKTFDFDINQVSISDERRKAVDFSAGYYDVRQAVIALKGSEAAKAKTVADLKDVKLGAAGRHHQPGLHRRRGAARAGGGRVRQERPGEIGAAERAGRRHRRRPAHRLLHHRGRGHGRRDRRPVREPGLPRGSSSGSCSTRAARSPAASRTPVNALRKDGTLARLEQRWLSDAVDAPVLK